jgi:hypothetical protein
MKSENTKPNVSNTYGFADLDFVFDFKSNSIESEAAINCIPHLILSKNDPAY